MGQAASDGAPDLDPLFTGALVGWTARPFDGRILLRMQGVTSAPPHDRGDISDVYLVLDPAQAVQLGENLFAVAEASVPDRPHRTWLRKMLSP